jgi:hypothetical protein
MTRRSGPYYNDDHLRQGAPINSTVAETIPRWAVGGNIAIAATGVELSVAVPLDFGDTVGAIQFLTATTAAVSPTAGYVVLRDPAGAKLVQSADFGSTARAANTKYKVALTSTYVVTTPGMYYIGVSFTAGTIPTLAGIVTHNALSSGALDFSAVILSQSHGSAVGAVAPATIATPTTVKDIPYLVALTS